MQTHPLSKSRRAQIVDLHRRAGRERRGQFLFEGRRAIGDALARGIRFTALVGTDEGLVAIETWHSAGWLEGAAIHRVPAADMDALAPTVTPGGVLAIGSIPTLELAAVGAPRRLMLIADGVQDPGNLGTLIRTLVAAGGTLMIVCRGTVDPYNAKSLRAAAGHTLGLEIVRGVEPAEAVAWCRTTGTRIAVLEATGDDLFAAPLADGPWAVVVGNEADGVGGALSDAADRTLAVPMVGAVESLSVAVAGSIALIAIGEGLARWPSRGGGR